MLKNSRFSVTLLGIFLMLLKTTENILLLTSQSTNYMNFPFQREAKVKNQSIISTRLRYKVVISKN